MDFSETSIVNATLWLLACFSLLTWCVILLKLGEWLFNIGRNLKFTKESGLPNEPNFIFRRAAKAKSQFARIIQSGQSVMDKIPEPQALSIQQSTAWHDLMGRAIQQQLHKEKSSMDSGLGLLASFGSTSPFIGLFGTVWGIMHALQDISAKGSASLEVVAGPIGEALIATAIGIGVAIPAVLGYNFFIRINRNNLAKLGHFADDYQQAVIQHHLQQQKVSTHGIPSK